MFPFWQKPSSNLLHRFQRAIWFISLFNIPTSQFPPPPPHPLILRKSLRLSWLSTVAYFFSVRTLVNLPRKVTRVRKSWTSLNFYVYAWPFIHCLYFIDARKRLRDSGNQPLARFPPNLSVLPWCCKTILLATINRWTPLLGMLTHLNDFLGAYFAHNDTTYLYYL